MNGVRPQSQLHQWLIPGLLLIALWGLLCWSLSTHWSVNPQYSFGWLVPPLALYLGARRWSTRPKPEVPTHWAWPLLGVSAFAFFPTWLMAQPNPDWRLVNWLMASEVFAFSVGISALAGGMAWARHFAIPLCLILLAVPWPSGPEADIIGGLMRSVAGLTVAVLNLAGIPALQHGNLIEIRAGMLGVDEACSGVRSLQATLMAAVALGELYRFPAFHRAALLLISIGVAFLTNAGRAFLLAWNAAKDGIEAVNRWHDPAGFSVMTICFALVWGVAAVIGRNHKEPRATRNVPAPHEIPRGGMIGFAVWFAVVLLATELWFRSASANTQKAQAWSFIWPDASTEAADAREVPITPAAAEMLRFDEARGVSWMDANASRWLVYHLRWIAGPSRSRILAQMHRPEHCLPSTGWQLAQERPAIHVPVGDVILPFRALRFTQGERNVHVWFCTVQDHGSTMDESARSSSIQAVLRRERSLGQQVLEVALFSPISGADADVEFRREIVPRLQATVPK